jgi:hypothetical protein
MLERVGGEETSVRLLANRDGGALRFLFRRCAGATPHNALEKGKKGFLRFREEKPRNPPGTVCPLAVPWPSRSFVGSIGAEHSLRLSLATPRVPRLNIAAGLRPELVK